jgi:hypothetical protein
MRSPLIKTLLLSLATCGLVFVFGGQPLQAAINPQISFQGKLTNTDGTNVSDGNYSIRFRIYSDPTADTGACVSTCKWEETQGSVAVSGGLFNVNLGSGTALPGSVDFNASALYLGIKVGSDSEMTPRVRLTAAPYAFNSDMLDGRDGDAFVQLSPGAQQTGNINVSGTVTSGAVNGITIGSTIQPSSAGALSIQANGANALNLTGGAASTFSTTAGLLTVQGAGGVTINTPNVSGASSAVTIQGGNSSSGTAGNVSIDTGTTSTGTPTVNIGAANAKAVQIGNSSSNPTVTIDSGTGTINIGNGAQARAINIGTGAAAQTITIGNGTSTTAVDILCGTGVCRLGQNAVAHTVTIGNTIGASAVTIDSGTGQINIGTGAQARTTNIATGGAAQTATLGSTNGSSSLTLQAGTGNLSLTTQGTGQLNVGANAVAQTITVGNTTGATSLLLQAGTGGLDITTQGTGSLDIGNNAVAQTINLGNGTGATTVSVLCGTGSCGFGNNAVAHATILGSTTGTATTTLQAGSGGIVLSTSGNITLGSGTGGTLLVLYTKTDTGDPTGVEGGLYYNTADNDFRANQNSRWTTIQPVRYAYLSTDRSSTSTTYADVTDLSFAVDASTNYEIVCNLIYRSVATTTGIGFALNGPASPTVVAGQFVSNSTATALNGRSFNAYNGTGKTTGVTTANVDTYGMFRAYFRNGTNAGTLQLRYSSEVGGSSVTVKANSYCRLSEL